MRRLVVIADTLTPNKRNRVTEMLRREHGVVFWHWFADAWLISDPLGHDSPWWSSNPGQGLESPLVFTVQPGGSGGNRTLGAQGG